MKKHKNIKNGNSVSIVMWVAHNLHTIDQQCILSQNQKYIQLINVPVHQALYLLNKTGSFLDDEREVPTWHNNR